jgi:hypothetical protein
MRLTFSHCLLAFAFSAAAVSARLPDMDAGSKDAAKRAATVCPSDVAPACKASEVPVCRNAAWVCGDRGQALREAACPGDVGPACEAPKIPACKDGKWLCIGPATASGQ